MNLIEPMIDDLSQRVLPRLNALPADAARARFLACCGSSTWAEGMTAGRPFLSVEEMHAEAERLFGALSSADWKEAFSSHPRIGETAAGTNWSAQEQSGVNGADRRVLAELAELNKAYFQKFGYIFIVFASGKSAGEMLAMLKERLGHDAPTELLTAAAEQAKITHLRLDKLLL